MVSAKVGAELLASKPEVASGMEPAYEAYKSVLKKELDNAKFKVLEITQPSES